jgi:hypothetical protein
MSRSAHGLIPRTFKRIQAESLIPARVVCRVLMLFALGGTTAARADEQKTVHLHGNTAVSLPQKRVDHNTLSQVRAGSVRPALPGTYLGVILWDERRVLPPPVRHAEERVTAQIEIILRQ